jgi:tellurite resistance protein TerC
VTPRRVPDTHGLAHVPPRERPIDRLPEQPRAEAPQALRTGRQRLPRYRFFVKHEGRRCATPLFAALVVIESSDVVFAIDSVPAVLSITTNTFVAYSSIAFAVLGLRHLYFALEGLIDRFAYLHYGLAAILVFVGAKFVAQGFGFHVPILLSLLVIAAALAVSIAASLIATRGGRSGGGNGASAGPKDDRKGTRRE